MRQRGLSMGKDVVCVDICKRVYGVLGDCDRSFLYDPERRTHALFALIFVHRIIECAQ